MANDSRFPRAGVYPTTTTSSLRSFASSPREIRPLQLGMLRDDDGSVVIWSRSSCLLQLAEVARWSLMRKGRTSFFLPAAHWQRGPQAGLSEYMKPSHRPVVHPWKSEITVVVEGGGGFGSNPHSAQHL